MPNVSGARTAHTGGSRGAAVQPVQYPTPKPYEITEAERRAHDGRFWRMPVRLVTDGTWAALWKQGEAVTSVLAVLAIHGIPRDSSDWTEWCPITARKAAGLAGVNKESVTKAMRALEVCDLMERRERPHPKHRGLGVTDVRLSARLYPSGSEKWRRVPAALIYSGEWARGLTWLAELPRWRHLKGSTARHFSLTLLALHPVDDAEAYMASLLPPEEPDEPWHELDYYIDKALRHDALAKVEALRSAAELSVRELARMAGLPHSVLLSTHRHLHRFLERRGWSLHRTRAVVTPDKDGRHAVQEVVVTPDVEVENNIK